MHSDQVFTNEHDKVGLRLSSLPKGQHFIRKPFGLDEIARKLKEVLGHGQAH
jgi:hypothetical protein